jgi:type II secretory pathway component PulK
MRRNQGAVLTLVIVALMLVGVVMFVLTEGSNTMLFQADAAYLQAVERNLIASGLAWARARLSSNANEQSAEPVELNTAAFGLPNAKLVVRILDVQGGTAKVRIETSCHKGRRTLHASRTFSVAGPPPAHG